MTAIRSNALNLNVFALALGLALTLLGVSWGVERREAEADFRALSEARVKTLAQKLAALDKIPERLEELAESGQLSPDDLKDGWGNALIYDRENREVISLGADGLPSGEGFGKDIRLGIADSNPQSTGIR